MRTPRPAAAPAVLACALLGLAAPPAQALPAAGIADRLGEDAVYVEGRVRARLDERAEARLERLIARRDDGRIALALVSEATARRAGGVRSLANAIDAELDRPGVLMVTAGSSTWLTTSFGESQAAVAATQRAFDRRAADGLPAQLAAVVEGLADVDPGPSGDLDRAAAPAPSPAATPEPPVLGDDAPAGGGPVEDLFDDIADTFRTTMLALVALVALVIALVVGALVRRSRRAARVERERHGHAVAAARATHAAIGDGIRELDLDASLHADPAAHGALGRAIDAYDRVAALLPHADEPHDLEPVHLALRDGESALAEARARLSPPGAAA